MGVFSKAAACAALVGLASAQCIVSDGTHTFDLSTIPFAGALNIKQVIQGDPGIDGNYTWAVSLCKPVSPSAPKYCAASSSAYVYEYPDRDDNCVASMNSPANTWSWNSSKVAATRTFKGWQGRRSVQLLIDIACDVAALILAVAGDASAEKDGDTWIWHLRLKSQAVCVNRTPAPALPPPTPAPTAPVPATSAPSAAPLTTAPTSAPPPSTPTPAPTMPPPPTSVPVAPSPAHPCIVSDGTHTFDLSTIPFAGALNIKQVIAANPGLSGYYQWAVSLCNPVGPQAPKACSTPSAYVYEYPNGHDNCVTSMSTPTAGWIWDAVKAAATRTVNGQGVRAVIDITCDSAANTLTVAGDAPTAKQGNIWVWNLKLKSKAVCAPPMPPPAPSPAPATATPSAAPTPVPSVPNPAHPCTVSDGTHTFDLSTIPFAGALDIKQLDVANPTLDGTYIWSVSLCSPQPPTVGRACGRAATSYVYEYSTPVECLAAMDTPLAPWRWVASRNAATRSFKGQAVLAVIEITCDPKADTLTVNGRAPTHVTPNAWVWYLNLKSKAVCAAPANSDLSGSESDSPASKTGNGTRGPSSSGAGDSSSASRWGPSSSEDASSSSSDSASRWGPSSSEDASSSSSDSASRWGPSSSEDASSSSSDSASRWGPSSSEDASGSSDASVSPSPIPVTQAPAPATAAPSTAPAPAPAPGPYGFRYCGAAAPARGEVRGQTTKTLAVVDGVGSALMCPCLTVASNTEKARRIKLSIVCGASRHGPFATVQELPKMTGYSAAAPVTAECPVRGYFAIVAWNPSSATATLDYGAKCVVSG